MNRNQTGLLVLAVSIAVFQVRGGQGEKKEDKRVKYFSATSLSLVLTRGNNQNFTFSLDTDQNLHLEKNRLNLKGRMLNSSLNGKKSEIYYSHFKFDRELNSRAYLLGFFRFERNKYAGYNFRFAFSAGGGITWVRGEKTELNSEIALGWNNENNEQRIDLNVGNTPDLWKKTISVSFPSSILINKLTYNLSPNAQLVFQETFFANLEDFSDSRLNSYSSASASLSRNFALQTSIQIIYENKPVPGFKKTDLFLLSSLVIKI